MPRPRQTTPADPSEGSRRVERLTWIVVAMLLLAIAGTWSLAIARYGGPDEPGHILRAAAVSRGEILGPTVPGLVSGFRATTVPGPLTTGDPQCFRHNRRIPATCAVADTSIKGLRTAASTAGTNPPWYYAMVGVPVRLLGEPANVVAYRLVAAGWCALALAAALWRARRNGSPRLLLAAALSISPAMWFLFGVVNPNSLEIALFVLAWVGVVLVAEAPLPTMTELLWIGLPCGAAIMIRPIAVVAAATLFAVVAVLRRGAMIGRRHWLALAGPSVLAGAAGWAWGLWSGVAASDARAASPLALLDRFIHAVSRLVLTGRELAGSLGWAEFSAPWLLQTLWWGSAIAAGILALRARRAQRAAWFVILASTVCVPIAFESALAGRIGFIWQGRYSIPTAVGLIIVGLGHGGVPKQVRSARATTIAALVSVVAVALVELGSLWATLRRYTVGTDGSWLFRRARWHPALAPLLLLATNAVLVAVLVAVLSARLRRRV